MEMELRHLTDRAEIGRIYREHMTVDFPRNELKPLAMIYKAMDRNEYACC